MIMAKALADQLEVWGFDGEYIVFSAGSLGFGLDLRPLDVSCWEDVRLDDLARRTAQFLNRLPPRIDVQFVQDIQSGYAERLEQHVSLASPVASDLAELLMKERIAR